MKSFLKLCCLSVIAFTQAPAFAADTLQLDPVRVTCRIGTGSDYRTFKCDVIFDGFLVHVGRSTSEALANGDCVKCRGTLDEAKALFKNVRMLRGYWGREPADWHLDDFFTVSAPDKRCE